MNKKIMTIFLLSFFIPFISAEPIYVLEGTSEEINFFESDGYPTRTIGESHLYKAVILDSKKNIIHKQSFSIAEFKEFFLGPECFDENMVLLENVCEEYNLEEMNESYFRIHLPALDSASTIEVFYEEKMIYTKTLENKSYKPLIIIGLFCFIVLALILIKIFKQKNINKEKVIR